jgi:RNA polymerase sigma-70 factor (ECF subfamily)
MSVEPSLRNDLLAALPSLRAFAISLTHDHHRADDLVQDTIMRAWRAIDRFEPGTNLNAWLFTILRNLFHSEYRKKKREVDDPEGSYAAKLKVVPDQQAHLDFEDMRTALAKVPMTSARLSSSWPLKGCLTRRPLRSQGWRWAP